MAEAVRLSAEHAELLASLECVFPEPMRQGEARLRHKLSLLASSRKSFCWLLRSRGEFVAYLVSWLTRSRLAVPQPDVVILIDDLHVTPGHPTALFQILTVLGNDLQERGYLGTPIEGVCRRNAYKTFMDHQGVIRRFGYELAGTSEFWDAALGEEMCWMRWHFHSGTGGGALGVRDATEISREALEEELENDDDRAALFRLFS